MNSIMCSKAWLGFYEVPVADLLPEEQLLAPLNDAAAEGDLPIVIANDVSAEELIDFLCVRHFSLHNLQYIQCIQFIYIYL